MSCEQKPSRKELAHCSSLAARSHQFFSHHIQGHGAGEAADSFAVTGESALNYFRPGIAGQGMEYETYWFVQRAAAWAGYSCNTDAEC